MTQGDWIPDEAITSFEEDRLGHRPIVKTVSDLVEHGPVPSNIAVFGPWGSGKTSFGRLLEQELATRTQARIKFVRFDAWKYQETPLRRHFLSQVLGQLLDDPAQAESSRRRLYQKVHKTTYRLSKEDLWPALTVGGAVLGLIVLLAVAIAMLGAWMVITKETQFWPMVASRLSENLPAVLLSTAVLAPLVTILMGPLTRDFEESEPSSAEQFDAAFKELAEAGLKRWGRIVFFIDELDRAPADAVVSTLETIKTFLGATGCVFIVAADQIVLESALQQKPPVALTDRDNPYFTAGSGYLDKVFGYQFSLPPIAQARLTPFAKALVTGRGGVWAALGGEADLVVSVLIPFHVRSPRRAKVLLNNFVLAFRNLQQLPDLVPDRDPKSGAAELAKLVCIRTEFPVFYRAVEVFPELVPALTAALTHDTSLRRYEADEELMAQVRHFLRSDASVDIMLAPASAGSNRAPAGSSDAPRERDASALDDELPEEEEAADEDDEEEVEEEQEDEGVNTSKSETTLPGSSVPVAGKTLADHLHMYLRNTAAVPGPSRSLIYQEAQAAPTGLEPSLAKTISESAYSGDPKRAIAQLTGVDESVAKAALRYLGMLLSESVGIEKRSVLHVLLSVADLQPSAVLSSVANDLLDHMVSTGAIPLIDPKDFGAAFNLAARAPAVRREDLEKKLAARSSDDDDAAAATFHAFPKLSKSGQRVVRDLAGNLAAIGSRRLFGTEQGVADAVTRQIWKGHPVARLAQSLAVDNGDAWSFAERLIPHLDEESAWDLVGPNLESPTPERLDRVSRLLSQGTHAPARRAAFDQLLGAMVYDASRVELFAHAVPRTAVEPSQDKLGAVLAMLIRHAAAAPAEAHVGLMAIVPHLKVSTMPVVLLAPLRKELEVPFSQSAEIVAGREAQHQLLFTLIKEDSARESEWLDLLSASLIGMLGTGEPIIDEGRKLFRRGIDPIWRGRPSGETVGRLAEALRTDRAVSDQFTPSERRFSLVRIDHAMRRLSLGPFPTLDTDVGNALSGTSMLDRQTVALFVASHRPDPASASASDLILGAVQAAEADEYSRTQLRGYFASLSPAKSLGLLQLCLTKGIPAPTETLKVVKPRANERDWIDALRHELKAVATNTDRGRVLKFITVADVQDASSAARLRKTLVDVASGNRGAFELVVRASAEVAQAPGFAKETKRLGKDLTRTLSRRFSGSEISPPLKRLLDDLI